LLSEQHIQLQWVAAAQVREPQVIQVQLLVAQFLLQLLVAEEEVAVQDHLLPNLQEAQAALAVVVVMDALSLVALEHLVKGIQAAMASTVGLVLPLSLELVAVVLAVVVGLPHPDQVVLEFQLASPDHLYFMVVVVVVQEDVNRVDPEAQAALAAVDKATDVPKEYMAVLNPELLTQVVEAVLLAEQAVLA
jgi:hypothetical protein